MRMMKPLLLVILIFTFSGCFNYKDMNKLFFATAVLVDVDDTGNVIVYTEVFKAYRGEAQENGTEIRVVFKGKGKTIYEAFINSSLTADNEINITQVKALIFTERAASQGIDKFIDGFNRGQNPTVRMYLFVTDGKNAEGFMNTRMQYEQFLGLFLENLMNSQGRLSNIRRVRLNEYYNERMLGGTVSVIPILEKSQDNPNKIQVQGAAIIQNDKMVGKLSPDEVTPYNYVAHGGTFGVLLADNPNHEGEFVSLKVLRNKTDVSVEYNGDVIFISKKVKIVATIVESQRSIFLLNDSVRREIEKSAEENLERKCTKLFEEYRKQGIDIYNITRKFQLKYPGIEISNILDKTEFAETDFQVHIQGSNNTTDFN